MFCRLLIIMANYHNQYSAKCYGNLLVPFMIIKKISQNVFHFFPMCDHNHPP